MMMESSPTTIALLLLRNLFTSIFIYTDKSLLYLGQRYKLLQLLRALLISAILFILRHFPSLSPSFNLSHETFSLKFPKTERKKNSAFGNFTSDLSIARALWQLLSIMNDIPVSSRKYEIVRSLAEKVIDDNLREGCQTLRKVNCTVLSAAFPRTLSQLEARTVVLDEDLGHGGSSVNNDKIEAAKRVYYKLNRLLLAVRYYSEAAWSRLGKSSDELGRDGKSAEKLSAEILWLAQKMAACGCAEEAVYKWASASKLAVKAIWVEPRLQGSLVKVSAFLIKQARELGGDEEDEDIKRETKMKLLMSWLPFLCRASNGTDTPVLSINEKAELEKMLEEIIESLGEEEEKEKVLSLWLHHFTRCPSSDWPNLHACYERWCTASRKLLLLQWETQA